MRKAIALIFIFTSCVPKQITEMVQCNLEGEWVYQGNNVIPNTDRIIDHYSGIAFKDNEFYKVSDHGRTLVGTYRMRNDSLIIQNESKHIGYKLLACTKDSLHYLDHDVKMYFYNKRLDFNPNLRLDSLYLNAGSCFGDCYEFEFTINKNDLKGRFVGGKNSKIQGEHFIELTTEEWAELDSLFKWTRIEQYDSSLFYGAIDDWAVNLEIRYNETQVKKIKGTKGGLFYRLQPIVNALIKKLKKEKVI